MNFRIYAIIKVLFPALPPCGGKVCLESALASDESDLTTTVDSSSVVFPHLLPRVHSSVFPLYTLHYKREDDEYWARILKWNRHPDLALLTFLDVAQKFWIKEETDEEGVRHSMTQVKDKHFGTAVETLQHIKTKFTPLEKLHVVMETFREVNK